MPQPTTNYQALGEYTAYTAQAKDAADARFARLHNLGGSLIQASKTPHKPLDVAQLQEQLDKAVAAEREMLAATARANQAAALCGQPEFDLYKLCRD